MTRAWCNFIPPFLASIVLVGTGEGRKRLQRATNLCNCTRTWRITNIFAAVDSWGNKLLNEAIRWLRRKVLLEGPFEYVASFYGYVKANQK